MMYSSPPRPAACLRTFADKIQLPMLMTSAHTIEGAGVSSLELTPEDSAVVRHLAHELRQPLSTIESTAYYLGIILPPGEVRARKQVDKLPCLVPPTNHLISHPPFLFAPACPH